MVEIKGYEGLYSIDSNGDIFNSRTNKKLNPSLDSMGYTRVNLTKESKQRQSRIHRIIAIHFIPNPKNKPCINHKNGIKIDNRIENLEWCTYSENNKHAYDTGLKRKGENHYNAKLSDKQVEGIRELRSTTNLSQSQLGLMYGVSREHIRDIVNYKRRL